MNAGTTTRCGALETDARSDWSAHRVEATRGPRDAARRSVEVEEAERDVDAVVIRTGGVVMPVRRCEEIAPRGERRARVTEPVRHEEDIVVQRPRRRVQRAVLDAVGAVAIVVELPREAELSVRLDEIDGVVRAVEELCRTLVARRVVSSKARSVRSALRRAGAGVTSPRRLPNVLGFSFTAKPISRFSKSVAGATARRVALPDRRGASRTEGHPRQIGEGGRRGTRGNRAICAD